MYSMKVLQKYSVFLEVYRTSFDLASTIDMKLKQTLHHYSKSFLFEDQHTYTPFCLQKFHHALGAVEMRRKLQTCSCKKKSHASSNVAAVSEVQLLNINNSNCQSTAQEPYNCL